MKIGWERLTMCKFKKSWKISVAVIMLLVLVPFLYIQINQSNLKHLESARHNNAILPVNAIHKIDVPLLQDRDALIANVKSMDDYIGIEITQQELVSLAENNAYQDYKYVLLTFVEDRLGLAVDTFETIEQSDNQRWVLVTTKTQNVLKISMTRWPEHNNIWTIEAVATF